MTIEEKSCLKNITLIIKIVDFKFRGYLERFLDGGREKKKKNNTKKKIKIRFSPCQSA